MTRAELINSLIERGREARAADRGSEHPMTTSAFTLGDVVVMRNDPEPYPGTVTKIEIRPGAFVYGVTWCDTRSETPHYDFELARWDAESIGQAG